MGIGGGVFYIYLFIEKKTRGKFSLNQIKTTWNNSNMVLVIQRRGGRVVTDNINHQKFA